MNTGFIGMGNLGLAAIGRLSECDCDLVCWNRSPEKSKIAGLTAEKSAADVARKAQLVFICLFDSQAVKDVLLGEDGLLAGVSPSTIIVDLTTHHFEDVLDIHKLCKKNDVAYLEAPVLGSVVPASKGALTMLVSGDRGAYEKSRVYLEMLAKHIFYCDEPGKATRMKLVNNLALGGIMAVLAEAVALGEEAGIDKVRLLEILSVGGGASLVLNAKREKLLDEDFSPHFSNELIYKDLKCLSDMAYKLKRPLYTGSIVKELYATMVRDGMEGSDFSSIYTLFASRK